MKKMSISTFVKLLQKKYPEINFFLNETFKDLTTFRIGGKIKALIEITSTTTLLKILTLANKHAVPYFILGKGSNLLVSDTPKNYLVLKICLNSIKVKGEKVICGSGVSLFKLNSLAIKESLTGLEWSFGIPGSVGGAIKMNAGSFGGEIKHIVETVYYTNGTKIFRKRQSKLNFSYRQSFFSTNNYVILKVVFKLKKGEKKNIQEKCLEVFTKRKQAQPYDSPSAGSVFKKPNGTHAPLLIEKCNLKGFTIGGAQISTKHCGFIINYDNATFNDVFKLIAKIKKTILKKFDIILTEEIIILR